MKDLMHYRGYYGSVHLEETELVLYGNVEFIRALVTYEANDARGLMKAFQDAVDDYLETCQRLSIEPEQPFKGSLNVRLGSTLHRQVALAAEHHHLSINKFIVQTLQNAVDG